MGRYRTINTDLNRQYRNDLNANFTQIEQDILGQENFTVEMKNSLLTELSRIERESKERDDFLAGESLEVLLQSITDAKNSANTAASNANTKATHAQTQGDYAKGQGDYAKNQGDYAKTKGDYANEKAILADGAAGKANAEASNLSQLKGDVVTATQNANTAKSNAETATTNANNAGSYATTQGDYAKLQGDRAKDVVEGTGLLTQTDIGVKVAGFNASGQVLDKNGNIVEGKVKTVNDVGPDTNGNIKISIPSKISDLTNDSGFITVNSVTKDQVGLGNVQNYTVATQAEAEVGTSTSKYMTPQRTKQAIDALQAVKSVNGQTGEVIIPSGSIEESGSNANGAFIKFSDGSLICYIIRIPLSYSSPSTFGARWTMPHAFNSIPVVLPNIDGGASTTDTSNNLTNVYPLLTGTTYSEIRVRSKNDDFKSTNTAVVNVLAIGRWRA